jgi:hypothetical protein
MDHKLLMIAVARVTAPILPHQHCLQNATTYQFDSKAAEQHRCMETQCLLSGTSLTIAFQQARKHQQVGNVSTGVFQPVGPQHFSRILFPLCTISHTQGGLIWDMAAWTKTCLHCQQIKIQHHTKMWPVTFPSPCTTSPTSTLIW